MCLGMCGGRKNPIHFQFSAKHFNQNKKKKIPKDFRTLFPVDLVCFPSPVFFLYNIYAYILFSFDDNVCFICTFPKCACECACAQFVEYIGKLIVINDTLHAHTHPTLCWCFCSVQFPYNYFYCVIGTCRTIL